MDEKPFLYGAFPPLPKYEGDNILSVDKEVGRMELPWTLLYPELPVASQRIGFN